MEAEAVLLRQKLAVALVFTFVYGFGLQLQGDKNKQANKHTKKSFQFIRSSKSSAKLEHVCVLLDLVALLFSITFSCFLFSILCHPLCDR